MTGSGMPQTDEQPPSSPPQSDSDESKLRRSLEDHLKAASELGPAQVQAEAALLQEVADGQKPPKASADAPQFTGPPLTNSGGSPTIHACQQPVLNIELASSLAAQGECIGQWLLTRRDEVGRHKGELAGLHEEMDQMLLDLQERFKSTKKVSLGEDALQRGANLELPPVAVWKLVEDWPAPLPAPVVVEKALQAMLSPLELAECAAVEAELAPVADLTNKYGVVGIVLTVQRALRWQVKQREMEEAEMEEADGPPGSSISDLQAKLVRLDRQRVLAADAGRAQQCDESQISLVCLLEEIMFMLRSKLKKITTEADASGREELDRQRMAADKAMADWRQEQEELIGHVKSDHERLSDLQRTAEQEHREHAEAFRDQIVENWSALHVNTESQSAVFVSLGELMDELMHLQQQRQQIVDRHKVAVEQEAARVVAHEEWVALMHHHLRQLVELQRRVEASLELCGGFHDFYAQGFSKIAREMREAEIRADEMRRQVMVDYLAAYRSFTQRVGDLVFRKEQLLSNIERKVRAEQLQIDTAAETLDPGLEEHRTSVRQLEQKRRDLVDLVREMKEKAEEEGLLFQPVCEGLEELGVEFEHPSDELERTLVQRENALLSTVRSFVDTERVHTDSRGQELLKRSAKSQLRLQEHTNAMVARRQYSHKKVSKRTLGRIAGSPARARTTGQPPVSTHVLGLSSIAFTSSEMLSGSDLSMSAASDAVLRGPGRPATAGARRELPSSPGSQLPPRPQTAGVSGRIEA